MVRTSTLRKVLGNEGVAYGNHDQPLCKGCYEDFGPHLPPTTRKRSYKKAVSGFSSDDEGLHVGGLGLRKEQHLANQVGSSCGRTKQIRRNKLHLGT